MTTASRLARPAEQVEGVDFAVPGSGTIGPRFASWREAVGHARAAITRLEYRGQRVNEDAPDFHPRRHFQEGGTLVVYTRAFVHMRTRTAGHRPGGWLAGRPGWSDSVVCAWEVFHDGTVESLRETSEQLPEQEQAAARQLESSGYQILDRGWHGPGGRLAIVAADRTTLVVCEVRPRSTGAVIRPAERDRLRKLAAAWLTAYGDLRADSHASRFAEVRLDLALYYTDQGRCAIEHIPGVG